MASRMGNIASLLSDQKSRTIILFTGIILVAMVIWGITRLTGGSSTTTQQSDVSRLPRVDTTPDPDRQPSQQMLQNVKETDQKRIGQAEQSGNSAIGTILPSQAEVVDESATPEASADKTPDDSQTAADADKAKQQALDQQQMSALNNQLSQSQQALVQSQTAMAQQEQQAQQQALQEAKAKQEKLAQSMKNQAQAVMAAWSGGQGTPQQAYVEGELAKPDSSGTGTAPAGQGAEATGADDSSNPPTEAKQPAAIKAGDVLFAVLNTAVNSDEPGPVLATVVAGKLRGAKVVGAMQQAPEITGTNGPTAVILSFDTLSTKTLPNSVSISAVAVDSDTARTALASEVDHHYMYRYGTLFASSFLSGYGNAITQSGSVSFNDTNGAQTTFQQTLNPTETFLAALGEVGTQLGDKLSDSIDRPNTIYVNDGTTIGLLFLKDVTIDQMAG